MFFPFYINWISGISYMIADADPLTRKNGHRVCPAPVEWSQFSYIATFCQGKNGHILATS